MNPQTRRLVGRVGGLTTVARHGGDAPAARARKGFADKFERQVDPDGLLSEPERLRRAQAAMRAHMAALALRSAQARRKRQR